MLYPHDWLIGTIAFLVSWLLAMVIYVRKVLLARIKNGPERAPSRAVLGAAILSGTAVLFLLLLHISWLTPDISQTLGDRFIRVLSTAITLCCVVSLALGIGARSRVAIPAILSASSCASWHLILAVLSAMSFGSPLVRHSNHFFIPETCRGWIIIRYGQSGFPPLATESGARLLRISTSCNLNTSSEMESGWSSDEYKILSRDGRLRQAKETGWGAGGEIWGNRVTKTLSPTSQGNSYLVESFFVGSEDAFKQSTEP